VLTRFNPHDQAVINDVFDTCIRAVEKIVTDGVLIAMNEFNGGSNSD
jgi:peptidyl-tRNA hydrolase